MHRWAMASFFALFVTACSVADSIQADGLDDLGIARAQWAHAGLEDYDLDMVRLCFCSSPAEVVVRVRGGVRVEVLSAADGGSAPLAPEQATLYPTVEELFGLIDEAVRKRVDELRVRYHPSLGYPVDLWIDERRSIDDDEVGFRVDLRPVGLGA